MKPLTAFPPYPTTTGKSGYGYDHRTTANFFILIKRELYSRLGRIGS